MANENPNSLKLLEWDSEFWNVDLYKLEPNYQFNLSMVENKFQKNKRWIVQALVADSENKIINSLEDRGFRFIESKIFLRKKVKESYIGRDVNIIRIKNDIEINQKDFDNLFKNNSRFLSVNENKINDFYFLWILKSIKGEMDEYCYGYFINDKIAGIITFSIINDLLIIGILGVVAEFQKKGISQQLLNFVNSEAKKYGCRYIDVSTQGKNYKAVNSYLKNGFLLQEIKNWYYLFSDINI